ncbi:MAG TPA: hypothetical protein VHO69_18015 [Phototrophicaceae bacterium]|nr:hypothetical protein [Phototrophicaceae bacterium]
MMNSKGKSKRSERRSHAAVEFIVPLQLEQCLNHINHQPRGMPLRVTVAPAEDGTMHLTARLRHNGVVTVRCEGELRRWQGTSMQVVGQVEVQRFGILDNGWGCMFFPLFVLMWLVVTGLSLVLPYRALNNLPGAAVLILSPLLLCLVTYLLEVLLRRWQLRRELFKRLKRVLNGTEKY